MPRPQHYQHKGPLWPFSFAMTPLNFSILTDNIRYVKANGTVTFKNKAYSREYWVTRGISDVYDDMMATTSFLPPDTSISVRYFFIEHNLVDIPLCPVCGVAINLPKTYGDCLPTTHAQCIRAHVDHKIKQTNLERYGGNPMCNPDVRARLIASQAHIDRHEAAQKGKLTRQQTDPEWGSKTQAKKDASLKLQQAMELGYTSARQYHIPTEVINRINNVEWLRSEYLTKPANQIAKEQGVNKTIIQNRLHRFGIDTIHRTSSLGELEIVDFIRSISSTEIQRNVRNIRGMDFELDIFLPEFNIAIEYHGQFWHTESNTPRKNIHRYKHAECVKRSITLMQIWSSEWKLKREIVESRIRHKLLASTTRIGARTCSVRVISTSDSRTAINQWHIQGVAPAAVHLGLYSKESLVGVMTFSPSRYNKNYQWELVRFCTSPNMIVVGGASKLFNYFIRTYSPVSIISYSNNRYGSGGVYRQLGMVQLESSPPGYYYVNLNRSDDEPMHRSAFQKHKLIKLLPNFDPSKTEYENMLDNGYDRIWDAGNKVFGWIAPDHPLP